jgi:serine phosphatase RsbU (regulator of sigma subunit)
VLYTDGLIETRRDGRVSGPDRLIETLAGVAGRAAEEVAGELLAASQRFAPGPPIDDTAPRVLRVRPGGAVRRAVPGAVPPRPARP